MPDREFTFIRDDVFPSWFANGVQDFLAVRPPRLRHSSTTAIQVDAAADDVCGLPVKGRWRYITATITKAHPGGIAGDFDVFVTAIETHIVSTPDPFTDATTRAFGLAIVAAGGTPAIVAGTVDVYRKVGSLRWDGTKITRIFQTVGEKPSGLPGQFEWHAGPVDADHPLPADRRVCDGTLVSITSVPGFFGAVGHSANGGVDPGSGNVRLPDARGRGLVSVGTHSDVSQVGATENGYVAKAADEANLAARRPKHGHTVAAHSHALPDHTHTVPAHFHGRGNLGISDSGHAHGSVAGTGFLSDSGLFSGYALATSGTRQVTQASTTANATTGISLSGSYVGNSGGSNGDASFSVSSPTSFPQSGSSSPTTDVQGAAWLTGVLVVYV